MVRNGYGWKDSDSSNFTSKDILFGNLISVRKKKNQFKTIPDM
ncbi:hypothetical protein SAMN02745220_05265 [Desulfopila aestuarii DSM 18488]|uniref:Uncharacterized protein n=1 Tax=Desulfopila aestuarii DSM 18488 TaxID=1121416 RepID=A0A1M7YM66_9BACT|nr:hypothetical protein SAMN02745220_05265 [Desulfopila aestuarii DSM 18488]